MLLTGTYPRTLDDKKRLAFPKRVREQLNEPDRLLFTPGPDQSLWIYSQDSLERLAEKLDQTPALFMGTAIALFVSAAILAVLIVPIRRMMGNVR